MIGKLSQSVRKIFVFFCIVVFSSLITILSSAVLHHSPPLFFLKYFLLTVYENSYNFHHNISIPATIAHINFYYYIYCIILVTFSIIFLTEHTFKEKTSSSKRSLSSLLLSSVFAVYVFLILMMIMPFLKFAKNDLYLFSEKSTAEKYKNTLKDIYQLPEITKIYLPGYHRTKFITDLNIKEDPGALYYRQLAYFLYPVDIRNIRPEEPFDSVLIFSKKNAIDYIPVGYQIHHTFNDQNIIAIKKK